MVSWASRIKCHLSLDVYHWISMVGRIPPLSTFLSSNHSRLEDLFVLGLSKTIPEAISVINSRARSPRNARACHSREECLAFRECINFAPQVFPMIDVWCTSPLVDIEWYDYQNFWRGGSSIACIELILTDHLKSTGVRSSFECCAGWCWVLLIYWLSGSTPLSCETRKDSHKNYWSGSIIFGLMIQPK